MTERARWWWGTAPSEITGESTKQYSRVDENRDIIKAAGMKIDPITGVIIYADDVPNGIGANFKVQSNAITAEVNSRKSEDEQLRGQIRVQANKISLVVTERDGRSVVNTASIVLGINNDHGSYIKLHADTVDLGNYATVGELNATKATINNLITGQSTFSSLVAASASLGGSGGGTVRIYGQTVRIYQVKDTNNVTRYVFGYA